MVILMLGRTAGFTKEERQSFKQLVKANSGFVDVYRHLNPGKQQFSYFGYRFGCRGKGLGWRLDYFVVDEELLKAVRGCEIRDKCWGASDHVPIVLMLESQNNTI